MVNRKRFIYRGHNKNQKLSDTGVTVAVIFSLAVVFHN